MTIGGWSVRLKINQYNDTLLNSYTTTYTVTTPVSSVEKYKRVQKYRSDYDINQFIKFRFLELFYILEDTLCQK